MAAKVVPLRKQKETLAKAIVSYTQIIPPGNTRRCYQNDLDHFFSMFSGNKRFAITVDAITAEDVAAFRDREVERDVAPSTLRRRLFTIRSFFNWAVQRGLTTTNPAKEIPLPRKNRPEPTYLTREEVRQLLAAPSHKGPLGIRDRAMLSLCYAAGLRVSELCSLTTDSIIKEKFPYKQKLRPGVIVKQGKGDKARTVPLPEEILEELKDWQKPRAAILKANKADTDTLFINRYGQPLTPTAFRRALAKHVRAAGIEKHVTPHTLRHSYGTHLAMAKTRPDIIAENLGHSDLSTTQIYMHIAEEERGESADAVVVTKRRGSKIL